MPILSHLHHLFSTEDCQATSIRCGGTSVRSNVPDVTATT
jgi:hypothetical protein